MAIILVTGLPGHGKTLWTLARLKPLAESENRPVFHNDIPELVIPGWQTHKADEWHDLPARSYMVIDEAQFVFPVRPRSSPVPEHYSRLATHRHGGLDLYVITQHPQLIDTFVRKLVDRHFHVVRAFGTKFATVYEFPTGVQDAPEKNRRREGVVTHKWRYPAEVYGWYRSAEVHTVKSRIPMRVWVVCAALLAIPPLFWFVYQRISTAHNVPAASAAAPGAVPGAASAPAGYARAVPPRMQDAMSREAYLDAFRPRIAGLAFTAPVYDQLTKPVEAPYPSVCMFSASMPCRCWSQRGFSLQVPELLCRQLAKEPMDPYWLRRGSRGLEAEGRSRDEDRDARDARQPLASPALTQVNAGAGVQPQ